MIGGSFSGRGGFNISDCADGYSEIKRLKPLLRCPEEAVLRVDVICRGWFLCYKMLARVLTD